MKLGRIFFVGSLLTFSQAGWSQITVNQSDLEILFAANRQTYLYADTTDSVFFINVGRTGGPHVYDFTGLVLSRLDTVVTIPASQVPQLVPRYPSGSIAFRFTEDRQSNEYQYFVYRFLGNGMISPGEANISPVRERFRHHVPEELIFPYPMTFGYSISYSVTTYDTTYEGGVPTQTSTYTTNVTKNVDGWGTLIVPGFGSFNCLRLRHVDLPPSQNKEFFYMTQEGYLLSVGTSNTQPDTGVIVSEEVFLLVPQSVVAVREIDEASPHFRLQQNYPNPFNPTTNIAFHVPGPGRVLLKVYDITGREVATLVNSVVQQGHYEVPWDASAYASGVYFYRLYAGHFVETKKLVVLK